MQDKPIDISSLIENSSKDSNLDLKKVLFITLMFYFCHFVIPPMFAFLSYPLFINIHFLHKATIDVAEIAKFITLQVSSISEFIGDVFAALITIYLTKKLFKKGLNSGNSYGAALNMCTFAENLQGAVLGLITFIVIALILTIFNKQPSAGSFNSIQNEYVSVLGLRFIIILSSLRYLFSVPIEEFIFRGILLGGIAKRFGILLSGITTTLLFVMLHYPKVGLTDIFMFTTISITAILLRLNNKSIVPPIFFHLTYNFSVLFFTHL